MPETVPWRASSIACGPFKVRGDVAGTWLSAHVEVNGSAGQPVKI